MRPDRTIPALRCLPPDRVDSFSLPLTRGKPCALSLGRNERLDFSDEYLALLSLTTAAKATARVDSSQHEELLRIAESL